MPNGGENKVSSTKWIKEKERKVKKIREIIFKKNYLIFMITFI